MIESQTQNFYLPGMFFISLEIREMSREWQPMANYKIIEVVGSLILVNNIFCQDMP